MSNGSRKWVTEQTSLTGGTVDIDVAEKTTLKGAVIASDTGDLTLATGSLEYSNIKDRDSSMNIGGGISASYGDMAKRDDDGRKVKDAKGNVVNEKGSDGGLSSASFGFSDNRQTNFATIGEGTIIVRDSTGSGTTDLAGLNRDVTVAQYGTMSTGVQLSADKGTIDLLTNPVNTFYDTVDGLNQIADRGIKIEQQTHIVEKSGNLIEHDHFTTDGQLVYYDNIDEYNNLKSTGGKITSSQELLYIGSRELIGDSLSNEELKDTALSYLQKRGDEYGVEGATKGYFKDYNNTLMFDNYLDQKLELLNNGIDQIPLTESDANNLSRTLKQGDGEALSIQLQNGYGMTPKQADITETTSCKSATIYWELKLSGAPVGLYSKYLDTNVNKGYIAESNGYVNKETSVVVGQYEGYQTKIIKDYDSYINGAGGDYGETRIATKVEGDKEKAWHSIPTYKSDDVFTEIADTGGRGYGKPAEDAVKQKKDNPQTYFKYYEYVEKISEK